MIPVINSAGVTSKPGFKAPLVGLATRTYARPGRARGADSALRLFHHAPGAEDFAFVAILNGNIEAAIQFPVDGGKRDGDVKWDFMTRG